MYDIWAHARENDSVLMAATVDRVMMVSVAGWGEGGPRFCLDTASSFPHRRLHGDPQPADNWELWQLRRTCTAFQKSKPDNCILPNRRSRQTAKTNIAVQLFGGQGGVFHMIYDSLSDVGEIRVYQGADFQSGSRVLKKVFWTLSYLYLWHTMWFHAKKLLKTLNR